MIHMFSKSYCPYCKKAIALARQYGIEPDVLQLDEIPDGQTIQNEIQRNTGQKTVPAIWINDNFIGGYNDLLKLHQNGTLGGILQTWESPLQKNNI